MVDVEMLEIVGARGFAVGFVGSAAPLGLGLLVALAWGAQTNPGLCGWRVHGDDVDGNRIERPKRERDQPAHRPVDHRRGVGQRTGEHHWVNASTT